MKLLFFLLFSLTTIYSLAQFQNPISVRVTGNLNAALNGLGADDAGLGFGVEASLFAKHKLQPIIESNFDHFFGDKVYYFDPLTGKEAKTNIYTIKVGLQYFVTKNLALSLSYGPCWYKVRDYEHTRDDGFKYCITTFLGTKRRFLVSLFTVRISAEDRNIHYLGMGAGYRL